jgi:hypothetical protein
LTHVLLHIDLTIWFGAATGAVLAMNAINVLPGKNELSIPFNISNIATTRSDYQLRCYLLPREEISADYSLDWPEQRFVLGQFNFFVTVVRPKESLSIINAAMNDDDTNAALSSNTVLAAVLGSVGAAVAVVAAFAVIYKLKFAQSLAASASSATNTVDPAVN